MDKLDNTMTASDTITAPPSSALTTRTQNTAYMSVFAPGADVN